MEVAAALTGYLGEPVTLEGESPLWTAVGAAHRVAVRLVDQAHGWACGAGYRLLAVSSGAVDGPALTWLALLEDGRWWPLDDEEAFRAFLAAAEPTAEALAGILGLTRSPLGASRLIVDDDDLARTAAERASEVEGPVAPTATADGGLTFLTAALHPDDQRLHRLWVWRWHVTGAGGAADLAWWAIPVLEGVLLDRYRP